MRGKQALNNAERFVQAYNDIDRILRRLTGPTCQRLRFSDVLERACQVDAAIKHFRDDLIEFHELRNAIVHKTRRGRIIAEPVLWAVERIEEIAGYLERPPRVYPMFGRSVLAFSPLDSVAYAVRNMHELDYSQAPVYSKDQFAGLLTADALVSWVGSRSEQCLDLRAFTVNEVLQQDGKKTGE